MLKVTVLKQQEASKGSTSSATKIANYYLTEEKSLELKNKAEMTQEAAESLGLSVTKDQSYGDYVLAETTAIKNTWYGKLAEEVGLNGKEVNAHDLKEALSGRLSGYDEVKRNAQGTRRNGHDFMFSAPKGMSIMAEVFGDSRIKNLHDESVKKALEVGARMIADYRARNKETGDLERIPTDKIMFALIHHSTSRAKDPQMHTHAILPNVTILDGKTRAITIDRLYEQKLNMFMGHIYQAEMNKGVMNLGYSTNSLGNGQYDISNIPTEVIEQTSKRRQEILKTAQEYGLPINSPKDIAALVSRDAKDYAGLSQVEGLWKASFDTYAEKGVFNGKDLLSESIMRQQKKFNKTQEKMSEKGESQSITPKYEAVEIKEEASNTIDRTIRNLSNYQTTLSYHTVLERELTNFNHEAGINFADVTFSHH